MLDGEARDVAGLRVSGVGDPRYTPDKSEPVGKDVEREHAAAVAASAVAWALRAETPPRVDVVAVHDPNVAARVGGLAPLCSRGTVTSRVARRW